MTEIPPIVADSDRLMDAVQRLVDGIKPDQWTDPTPCADWNVRQVLQHVTNGNVIFATIATGERTPGPITPEERAVDWLGSEPAAGFRATGRMMHDAFLTPGFLDGRFETPVMGEQSGPTIVRMRMNELLVHGWDLARGTGQPADLPEDLAEGALTLWQTRLGDRPRQGMPFDPPQPVADDAPAIDRLAAFLGAKALTTPAPRRPGKEQYFLLIALAARTRADCLGRRVGAVITREARVLSTGYNGTPFGMPNCSEGGCHRCSRRDDNGLRGGAYDICVCVHAEQNALLTAARFGQQTLGASMTSTTQPCFGCLKEMLQAGITEVHYLHPWDPMEAYDDRALVQQYAALRARFDAFSQVGDPSMDTPDLFGAFIEQR